MALGPFGRLRRWLGGRRSEHRWHPWDPGHPVLLKDGTMSVSGRGQIWRRRVGDRWEYDQDEGFDGKDDLRGIDWD